MDLRNSDVLLYRFNYVPGVTLPADLSALLGEAELERATQFRQDVHRQRFILRRYALRVLLARQLDVDAGALEFTYSALGKPSVLAGPDGVGLQFNTSSAGEWFVIALRSEGQVGVDLVEASVEIAQHTAHRILSKRELETWSLLPEHERAGALRTVWVRKEALLKASGLGLQIEPNTLEIGLLQTKASITVSVALDGMSPSTWSLLDINWVGAVAALCVAGSHQLTADKTEKIGTRINQSGLTELCGYQQIIRCDELEFPR